ncbi:MAG TPA: M20/M25/M40 family metallo-hydrolase [Gemmatimonadota bacterium]|nr:M20/M25/M40 family metallo-hydrolase [Gemmatimonadota bacterium]
MTIFDRTDRRLALAGLISLAAAVPGAAQTAPATCGPNLPPPPSVPPVTAPEICATIATLADDSMEGRRAGTEAADRAAAWIAGRFQAIGLEPPGEGGYLLPFSFPEALLRDPHAAAAASPGTDASAHAEPVATLSSQNVAGLVRGTDPALAAEAIVIGAHYDHLGHGGIGSLSPGEEAIHNGADDNASGVAGVLELAAWFAAHPQPRTLVFAAFGAEELGNIGSGAWVKDPPWPLERTVAMVNLDMVGRLREKLDVQGTGTSSAWPALLDSLATDPATPEVARVPDGFGPSDHASFYGQRIPVLALFTGAHDEYHRPGDDPGTIDVDGEVRVVELAARVIEAVADGREIPYAEAPVTQRRAAAFRVGLGVIPDYGYADGGLLLQSVRPDGAAAAAGLQTGDVIVRLAGKDVADVYAYTEILAGLEAGVPVEVVIRRGAETITTEITPVAR